MSLHWPQFAMAILFAWTILRHATRHGEGRGIYNFWTALVGTAATVAVLYCGGFWSASP